MNLQSDPSAQRPRFLIHVSIAVVRYGKILLVQEAKQASYKLWNLPGGHVEHGEPLDDAAVRELHEETKLRGTLTHLVGVYARSQAIRFVFAASAEGEPNAGDEILAVRFVSFAELEAMPDKELVAPKVLRAAMRDVREGANFPLTLVQSLLDQSS